MKITTILGITAILAVAAFSIWVEYGYWQECRLTNSFFYCWRILS